MLNLFLDPAAGNLRQDSPWVQVGLWGRWSDPSLRSMLKRPSKTSPAVADYSRASAEVRGQSAFSPWICARRAYTAPESGPRRLDLTRGGFSEELEKHLDLMSCKITTHTHKYSSPAGLQSSGPKQDSGSVRGIESRLPVGLVLWICPGHTTVNAEHDWATRASVSVLITVSLFVAETQPKTLIY